MGSQNRLQLSALILTLALTAPAFAQSKKNAEASAPAEAAAPANPDKIDVTDIESKYWASKDTDFSVVQNRLFPKVNRFSLSASAGPLVSNSNSDGIYTSLDASYYFSERWGIAATYAMADLDDNKSVKSLQESYGARPDHNRMTQYYGVSALWVPIYAKASFLNTKIVYFDFAISPGIGLQEYEQQLDLGAKKKSAVALSIDFTQQLFFSNHFALRADYRHRFYGQKVNRWKNVGGVNRELRDETQHDQILTFGATFFF